MIRCELLIASMAMVRELKPQLSGIMHQVKGVKILLIFFKRSM